MTTDDPIYTFKPGHGWIPEIHDHVITMRCGKVVRLECRLPVEGEMYDYVSWNSRRYFKEDKTPVWEYWETAFTGIRYVDDLIGPRDDTSPDSFDPEEGYMVAVPV